ncbi:MAG: hypothetical protein M3R17_05520 [Bacteroidota bacterium]|nr:hypothetical protein [Bacteroidota bacterium]
MLSKEHTRKYLLILVMGVLLLPLFQECTNLFREKQLSGFYHPAKKPVAGFDGWWNGTFQDSFEIYHNEQFGFRNSFVRLHNQVEYDLFRHPNANGIVSGKNDFLYELKYINAYNGDDYIGDFPVREMARKLKMIQDTLSKKNITLIVVFAPGKASFYPEYIPDELLHTGKPTNYKTMSALFNASGINFINFNSWFIRKKEKDKCPLYPKTGIHWSRYGSVLAMDSLISYIERKRNIDMPSVVLKGFTWSDSIQSPDDDIGQSLNLIFPVHPLLMAYPDYNFENPNQKAKVKMMVIGDSFFWNFYDIRLAPRSFESIDFWYYNAEVYHTDGRSKEMAENADNCLESETNEVVMLMASEASLSGFGWGYIDDAYDYFVLKRTDRILNKMIRVYETKIRMDPAWMMTMKAKAETAKIPLDSMIHLDAIYLAEQKIKK